MRSASLTPTGDVWLKFENDGDEEPSHEANTFRDEDGRAYVEFSHTAVGQIIRRDFDKHEAACVWLEEHGFRDFSS